MQLFPTKLLGVVADHDSFPVERIAIDQNGEGRWIGSAGHEHTLKMTDLKEVLEDEGSDHDDLPDERDHDGGQVGSTEMTIVALESGEDIVPPETEPGGEECDDPDESMEKKRKRKGGKDVLMGRKKRGRNEIDADPSFFAGL